MDGRPVPADATCLIYMAKADAFWILEELGIGLAVPDAVWKEAVVDGRSGGYAEVERIEAAAEAGLISRVVLDSGLERQADELRETDRLGSGESEVLAMAIPSGILLVDEGRATKVARAHGLSPISTLLLPVIAANQGIERDVSIAVLRSLASAANASTDTLLALEEQVSEVRNGD